jgi:hypothetical protein
MANCRSPITYRDVYLEDLRPVLQELVEFGCKYDENFSILFEDGRSRWTEATDGTSMSEADMSLASKLCWWADESDKFDDKEFDDVELEKVFLASDLGKRAKNQRRECYTLYNVRKARTTELSN